MKPPQTVALLALVVAAGLSHVFLYDLPFEDSYITFRYVRNLLDGHSFVYNPGETVEGFTSFGWVVLLAASAWTHIALPTLARIYSWSAGAVLLVLTAGVARRWAPDAPWKWLAAALLVGAHGTFAYYAASGMETTLFACLVVGATLLLFDEDKRSAALAGVALALSGVVRPEGFGYFAVLAATLATCRERRRSLPWTIGAFGLLFAPYYAWRTLHFGYPFPNTFYAKATGFSQGLVDGLRHAEGFLSSYLFWMVPLALVALGRQRRWDTSWRLVTAVVFAAFAEVLMVGGDGFAFYRFFLPAIPLGAVVLIDAVGVMARPLQHTRLSSRQAQAARVSAVVLLVLWTASVEFLPRVTLLGYQGKSFRATVLDLARLNSHYFLAGKWLRTNLPPDTLVAVNAAGIVPYVSRLPTLDMLGLNDVHIAHTPITGAPGAHGHRRHNTSYVMARRPGVILLGLPILSTTPLRPGDVEPWFGQWFPFLPGDEQLFQHPQLRQEYRLVTVEVRAGAWLAMFVRNDLKAPGLDSAVAPLR